MGRKRSEHQRESIASPSPSPLPRLGGEGTGRRRIGPIALPVAAWLLSACSLLPGWASVNMRGRENNTRASLSVGEAATRDGMFVGVALSGGGSRAANFGAGVLFELDRLRILERADFISSVSGGSIVAAYYALHGYPAGGPPKISFDRGRIDELFARDFQWRWVGRWFDPRNVAPY